MAPPRRLWDAGVGFRHVGGFTAPIARVPAGPASTNPAPDSRCIATMPLPLYSDFVSRPRRAGPGGASTKGEPLMVAAAGMTPRPNRGLGADRHQLQSQRQLWAVLPEPACGHEVPVA
jgi:hypothetical protein